METTFKNGMELQAGELVVPEDGPPVRVDFAIVEGDRNLVSIEGSLETITLTEDDVVEVVLE